EAQVVLPRFAGDLVAMLAEAAAGRLRPGTAWHARSAVTVVLASEGYPAAPRTGDVIDGVDDAKARSGVTVYCAGVGADAEGRLITAGGRVLAVTGMGDDLGAARQRAYEAITHISWPGMQYRRDIAGDAVRAAAEPPPEKRKEHV
ncbi:MAG: phosphoribosylamine--glycine ligase, partial [Actinomycetota bacterium]|nr:phosphoribosylamine--glycine ligase [Actinomycetota bacterium]